ncbi:MAG: putative transrane protein [Candidatus Saccharibacteria bacterium]|nr:putative transrane protein [Candidatus Saccharibacteria bacterium]
MKEKTKRILTDIGGYLLILLGIASGWLPGPGGIPLVLAGLGLLSINNKWAKDLREYLQENGGKAIKVLFPQNQYIQILYDLVVVLLLILVGVLAWRHAALWQISLAIALFFIALLIAGINRDRAITLKAKLLRR